MLAVLPSATLHGLAGRFIRVEVDVAPGLPGFTIVANRFDNHGVFVDTFIVNTTPLALGSENYGIRVATLITVGIAAIGAYIRGPGLGNDIFTGLARIGSPVAINLVLNACRPYEWIEQFPPVAMNSPDLRQRILEQWAEVFR